MNKNDIETIAFFSNNLIVTKPLFDWLKSREKRIILYDSKINASDIIDNNISFIISYNYIHMIKNDVLDLLPHRVVNLHISLLPWNRGADPNIWSFIEGTPCGVTIHEVDKGLDTGDILLQKQVYFDCSAETLKSSYLSLHNTMKNLFKDNWPDIKNGNIQPKKQVGIGSYHRKSDMSIYKDILCYDDSIDMFLRKASILKPQ